MEGFRKFLLRGNLVELAVAFVIGLAFAGVVSTFTNVILGFIGRVFGGTPNWDTITWWKNDEGVGIPVGPFFTAVAAFVILAAVVYFFVVVPYNKARDRFFPEEAAGDPADIALLKEIRDALVARGGGA